MAVGVLDEAEVAQQVGGEGHDAVAILQGPRHVLGKPAAGLATTVRTGLDLGLDSQLTRLEDDIDPHTRRSWPLGTIPSRSPPQA